MLTISAEGLYKQTSAALTPIDTLTHSGQQLSLLFISSSPLEHFNGQHVQ